MQIVAIGGVAIFWKANMELDNSASQSCRILKLIKNFVQVATAASFPGSLFSPRDWWQRYDTQHCKTTMSEGRKDEKHFCDADCVFITDNGEICAGFLFVSTIFLRDCRMIEIPQQLSVKS